MQARLVTIAAAALCVLGGTAAVAGSAAPTSAAVRPRVHVVNLHSAFTRAQSAAEETGPPAGIVPPRGQRTATAQAARAAASCTEPNCDLSYGGGAVQQSPHVYLLFWGPDWSNTSPVFNYMYNFYSGLGVVPDDTWSAITSQYTDSSGAPSFGSSVFEGAWIDSSTPPDPVTQQDLADEAGGFATSQGITDLADAQIVIASQSGTCFSDGFIGSCGEVNSSGTYCAWHSYTFGGGLSGDLSYTNLPYLLNAGDHCGENFVNSGSAGTDDGFSMVGGHEYAESITDPEPDTGWTDPADTISDGGEPGEIADKCVWGGENWGKLGSDPYGDVTLSTGSFAMQSLWSNAAGRCVLTTAPVLDVSTPGTQTSTLGRKVSFQVHASTNTGTPLTYSATGLPDGLSISSSTGKISGTPGVTAGGYLPRVTVSGAAGSRTVSFGWYVSSKPGAIKGYASKCADDYRNRKRNGNKIDIWQCDGLARQRITFAPSGELKLAGKCITASPGKAVLETCLGTAVQLWTRRSDGEYVVRSGDCLTDPGKSKKNGTQLRVETCTKAAGQRWSLP